MKQREEATCCERLKISFYLNVWKKNNQQKETEIRFYNKLINK